MPLHRHHAFNERVRVVAFKGEIFVVVNLVNQLLYLQVIMFQFTKQK